MSELNSFDSTQCSNDIYSDEILNFIQRLKNYTHRQQVVLNCFLQLYKREFGSVPFHIFKDYALRKMRISHHIISQTISLDINY